MSGPPPLEIGHQVRISAFDPEQVWSLCGHTLWIGPVDGAPAAIALKDIREVRLAYEPTRFQTNRFRCHLRNTFGKLTMIQNEHYTGIASFEDRSESYLALVRALIPRIADANPGCVFKSGTSALNWWVQAILLGIIFSVLLVVLVVAFTAIGALALVKLVLIVALVPVAIRWFRKNRPRKFLPVDIPAELLPADPL